MARVFKIGNLDNYWGLVAKIPEAMKEATQFEWNVNGSFNERLAKQVAERFADWIFHDWEGPSSFDLIVWEPTEEGEEYGPVFRVKINVRLEPQFDDSSAQEVMSL